MNYNFIAPYYHFLSTLVFGKTQIQAEVDAILSSKQSPILIVGGGDGKALKHISCQENREIDFLEISKEMMKIARKNTHLDINFLEENFFDFHSQKTYKHIILPFFLDNFSEKEAHIILEKVKKLLHPKGSLTIIDFTETPIFWQKILLKTMYSFFKITAQVETQKLPPIEKICTENGFSTKETFHYYKKFISRKTYFLA